MIAASLALAPAWASADEGIPEWVKGIFAYYVNGLIDDDALIGAIEFLIDSGIIEVSVGERVSDVMAPETLEEYQDLGDFVVRYSPNPNTYWTDWSPEELLREGEFLEEEADWLNDHLKLPHDILISAQECGEPNAFYYDGTITICYELLEYVSDNYYYYGPDYGLDPEYSYEHLTDVLRFVFNHELGHALIDAYDLPAVGIEEDSVDQFATLMLSTYVDDNNVSVEQDMLWNVGYWFLFSQHDADDGMYESTYWSQHRLDIQRFYNVACYAYGSDKIDGSWIIEAGWLPIWRQTTCSAEYAQMDYAWATLLEPYLVPDMVEYSLWE